MLKEIGEMLRGPRRPTRAELRLRRRRAGALAGVATVALVVGVVAGASGGASNGPPVVRARVTSVGWYGHLKTLAGDGAHSLRFEQRARENDAVSSALARSPIVHVAGAQHREMALTFDDGPGPYTNQVLDVLHRAGAPATFFVVGEEETYFHAATSRQVDLGMPIGDHTLSHRNLAQLSPADQRAQILDQVARVANYGASFPRLFRPPYGSYDDATLKILKAEKMLTVLWTIDSEDWQRPGADAIVHNVVSQAKPGAIVLLHDAGGDRSETVQALPRIISTLERQGYRLVTVPRLLLDNPPPANQIPPASLLQSGAG